MKLNWQSRELRQQAKEQRLYNWHSFFCLIPRRVNETTVVWFESIERRGQTRYYGSNKWTWYFRLPQ